MKPFLARCLPAASLAAALAVTPVPGHAEEKVMATVNGKAITETDLKFADQEVGAELGAVPEAIKRRYLTEYLIETELMAAAAGADKLGEGPDFEKRLAYMRQRALREAYFDKNVRAKVDDAAAKAFYDQQVKLMPVEEEIQARHILVKTEDEAKKAAEKIAGGADFAVVAKELSTDAGSKEDGGMLGYFGKGQMVPEFEQAAFALKAGEVSKPVKSQFGWHIIKLEDRRKKEPPKFEQVKGQLAGALVKQAAEERLTALRGAAKIEYVDPEVKKIVEQDKAGAGGMQ